MKHTGVLILCIIMLIGLSSTAIAGIIVNRDSQKYELYLINSDGTKRKKLVSAKSTTNACSNGCTIILIESGQQITFGPKDKIIIKNGVMNFK